MLTRDFAFAIRLLRRSPGFAASAIVTLALAIGANTAVFSAVKGILIAPLPYADPERLVRLFEEAPTAPHFPMSPLDFRDYRDELRTFSGLAAYMRSDLQIADGGRAELLRGMQVTSGFFELLGYAPRMGREFERADEDDAAPDVTILSHDLWARRFGADGAIVGRTIRLSGRSFRIVGVLPDGVQHVGGTYRSYGHGEAVDIWWVLRVPRGENPRLRYSHFFNVVGRVRVDATAAAVSEDLRAASDLVKKRYPVANSPWSVKMVPLAHEIVGATESTLALLATASSFVLVLACVNVAGLLLGRAASRAREMSVRAALGATRTRLTRQLLMETVVLAVTGGVLGIALAFGAVRALAAYGPADVPRLRMIRVDAVVCGYALTATTITALLAGLAPALRIARAGVAGVLKDGGRAVAGSAHQRVGRALAAVQLSLAFVLLVTAGLLLRSFAGMLNADPGFRADSTMTASLELPTVRYDAKTAPAFYARVLSRVRTLPGVSGVAFSSDLPWTGYDENTGFAILGRASSPEADAEARYHFITPGYSGAVGTRIVAGREFTDSDTADAPAVVALNESAARKYWSTPEAAVGARLNVWGVERTVAGVIGDVRDAPWKSGAVPALYLPIAQRWFPQAMYLIVHADMEPAMLVEPIRRAVSDLDPEVPLGAVRSLEQVAGAALASRRLTLWLVSAFGASAILLAAVGIYGVTAQFVGQRTQEFGIRQALGATRADIIRLVLSGTALMTMAGLACGFALALASTRLAASLLFEVGAADPVTFCAVALVLLAAGGAASYLPARRAVRVDPAGVLRT
jgi:predicted permease